jgi:2-polyprenyl-3-methyl-5-hydroxy-6-metoxy-1,4-benzoquinol methylase/glycosyltransferase involved in cell wall biosynthesis
MNRTFENIHNNHADRIETTEMYDKEYFEKHYNPPYKRSEPRWLDFFNHIADELVRSLKPRTMLDVGCAIGFLVEALWRRGVQAYGIDLSNYAIHQVPEDLKGFCAVKSVLEPLPESFLLTYDLITCIEVLEHMSHDEGQIAVKNIASKTRCILFSSTPHDDLAEPTHVNVRPVLYWLQSFAEVGFYPDLRFDASFVSPQAFLLRKSRPKAAEDILPFFAESINKKFLINAQQQEIARLKQSTQELQRKVESEVSKRDQEIQNFRSMRQQLQELLGKQQTEISQISAERAQVLQALATKEAEIIERDARIESLELAQSGLFWETLLAYRKLKERCLPDGTRRRAVYDRGLVRLKALKTETGKPLSTLVYPPKRLRGLNGANAGIDGSTEPAAPPSVQKFCLILSGCPGDTFRYRCEHQAEQLESYGFTTDVAYFDRVDWDAVLNSYQCFLLHRVPHRMTVERFIKKAEELGKPVIFDIDDLVFDEDRLGYIRALEGRSPQEVQLYRDNVKQHHRTLSLCKFAVAATEPLRAAVERTFPHIRCFINPNGLNDIQLRQAEQALQIHKLAADAQIVRIAYLSGTPTHNQDFKECAGALERVLETYSYVRLMLVGHLDSGEKFARFGDRIELHRPVPWQDLPRLIRRVDINLAPLELDNPFTECKSSLKYFETAILGVPTVASDLEPYRKSVAHGENGYLCRTEEEWFRCISCLIEDPSLREKMGSMARRDALINWTTRAGAHHLLAALREIAESSGLEWNQRLPATESDEPQEPGIFREHALAHQLLDGLTGLEIGAAAHNPFGLRTRNVALPEANEFYAENSRREIIVPAAVDIWAAADNIPVPDRSEDFIVSSHLVEHMPNPIGAFVEWDRILRDGGYVFMIVPLKGALPADKSRELTPLSHFVEDHNQKMTLDTHPTDGVPGERAGHYHTFTPDSLLEVVHFMRQKGLCAWALVAREDIDTKVGNGFTLVFKVSHRPVPDSRHRPMAGASPFLPES